MPRTEKKEGIKYSRSKGDGDRLKGLSIMMDYIGSKLSKEES